MPGNVEQATQFLYDFFSLTPSKASHIVDVFFDEKYTPQQAAEYLGRLIVDSAAARDLLKFQGDLISNPAPTGYITQRYVIIEGPTECGKTSITYSLERQLKHTGQVYALTEPPSILIPGHLLEGYYVWGVNFIRDNQRNMPCLGLPTWRHLCKGGLRIIPLGIRAKLDDYMTTGIIGASGPTIPGIPVPLKHPVFQLLAFVWTRLYFYNLYREDLSKHIIISNRSFLSTVVFQAFSFLVYYLKNPKESKNDNSNVSAILEDKDKIIKMFLRAQEILVRIHDYFMKHGLLPRPTEIVTIYPAYPEIDADTLEKASKPERDRYIYTWIVKVFKKFNQDSTIVNVNRIDGFGEIDQYENVLSGTLDARNLQILYERGAYHYATELAQKILGTKTLKLINPYLDYVCKGQECKQIDAYHAAILPLSLIIMFALDLGSAYDKAHIVSVITQDAQAPVYTAYWEVFKKFNQPFKSILELLQKVNH